MSTIDADDVKASQVVPEGTVAMQLHAECLSVAKRTRKTLVRVARTTTTVDSLVDEELAREHVMIERVAVGRVVVEAPPVRQEADVTILSVVEEVLVVERRLVLKEEVHLRRVRSTERHVETVKLRTQTVAVTRTDIQD